MIMKYETGRIIQNGVGTSGKVNGKILKVIFDVDEVLEDVSIAIYTDCGELIHESIGITSKEIHYPMNPIADDYYYNLSQMRFEVDGLNEGESVKSIIIIYATE